MAKRRPPLTLPLAQALSASPAFDSASHSFPGAGSASDPINKAEARLQQIFVPARAADHDLELAGFRERAPVPTDEAQVFWFDDEAYGLGLAALEVHALIALERLLGCAERGEDVVE